MKVINKETGQTISFDVNKLHGYFTNSLYIRVADGGNLFFLSQKGFGSDGSGDICNVGQYEVAVTSKIFVEIYLYAAKAQAFIMEDSGSLKKYCVAYVMYAEAEDEYIDSFLNYGNYDDAQEAYNSVLEFTGLYTANLTEILETTG